MWKMILAFLLWLRGLGKVPPECSIESQKAHIEQDQYALFI
jgi:hypothetical protein